MSDWDEKCCRIHPERTAEVWLHGAGTEVCRPCADEFNRELGNYVRERNVVLGWIQRRSAVLCPGCAHEVAIQEDARREIETFLVSSGAIPPDGMKELKAAEAVLERAIQVQLDVERLYDQR